MEIMISQPNSVIQFFYVYFEIQIKLNMCEKIFFIYLNLGDY